VAPVVPHGLAGTLELWRSFSTSANADAQPGRVQGGEAGLLLAPEAAFSLRLAYAIDDALAAGGTRETVELLSLGLEWHF
jgi:hypothetical protein